MSSLVTNFLHTDSIESLDKYRLHFSFFFSILWSIIFTVSWNFKDNVSATLTGSKNNWLHQSIPLHHSHILQRQCAYQLDDSPEDLKTLVLYLLLPNTSPCLGIQKGNLAVANKRNIQKLNNYLVTFHFFISFLLPNKEYTVFHCLYLQT